MTVTNDDSGYHWRRSDAGTFVGIPAKKDERRWIKVANCGISIKAMRLVIATNIEEVQYVLKFQAHSKRVERTIRHDDLSDEQTFMRSVPPGVIVTSATKAFQLLRECLIADLAKIDLQVVVRRFGWFRWQHKFYFAHSSGYVGCSNSTFKLDGQIIENGTEQFTDIPDIDQICSDVPILVGGSCSISNVQTQPPSRFKKYQLRLPDDHERTQRAIRAVFEILEICDPTVSYLAIASVFASAIYNPRYCMFLYGETGTFKTTFSLLLLAFFCPDPKESDCASFKSTENALRAMFRLTSNVLVIVDDYVQLPGSRNGGQEAKTAENLIRSVVNGAGRDRCLGNGELRPSDRPCGLPVITGEQLPDGLRSLSSRLLSIPIEKDTFKDAALGDRPNKLDRLQAYASDGTLAEAMGAFIAWASSDLKTYREFVIQASELLSPDDSIHRRVFDSTCHSLAGASLFLCFARDAGVISDEQFEQFGKKAMSAALTHLDRCHLKTLEDSELELFRRCINAALASGNCHLEVENINDYKDWELAIPLEMLGYQVRTEKVSMSPLGNSNTESAEVEFREVNRTRGKRIGWVCFEKIHLIPEIALGEANRVAANIGLATMPPPKSFGKILATNNWIAQQNKDRNTYKRRMGTTTQDVWTIYSHRLFDLVLSWSDFDLNTYRMMSEREKAMAYQERQAEALLKIRHRLSELQVAYLLGSDLTESDQMEVCPQVNEIEETPKAHAEIFDPPPPLEPFLPGLSDPSENGNELDS